MIPIPTTLAARFAPYRLAAELAGVVLALAAIGAASWLAYGKGADDKFNELDASWSKQQLIQGMHFAEQLKGQREQLEKFHEDDRRKDATYESNMRTVAAERDRALLSLRNRPQRSDAAAVPAACAGACTEAGATGSQLFREDGEFLVREAARADELRAALARCQDGDLAQDGGRLDR